MENKYITKYEIQKKIINLVNTTINENKPLKQKLKPNDIRYIIEQTLICIENQLKQKKPIQIRGFGTFYFRISKGKKAHDFKTGNTITLPEKEIICFNPSPELYESVINVVPCTNENGDDYMLTTVSMPPGVPVATVGINNGKNAAVLAGEILSINNPSITELLGKIKNKKINL